MSKPAPSSTSVTLAYLRERAQLAHLDGNGVLVNHLAAIALEEARKPRHPGTDTLPVSSWAWSVILSLFWLTDSYMLHEVEKTLEKPATPTDSDQALLNILRAYDWLVRQPLDPECQKQKAALQEAAFDWAKEDAVVEYEILLAHTLELLWFRDPRGADWQQIGKNYASQVPPGLSKRLLALVRRLEVQTSFCVLGAPALGDIGVDPEWDAAPWVPQLWQGVFDCDFAGLERILAAESPRHAATTPAARLLFDMRHFNRIHGNFGDPQAIGLTRRRLITTLSPELVFHSVREERVRGVIAELYSDAGGASDRFFGFTLAMLLEIAALRRWDLSAWCTAVEFQARLNAEVVAHDRTEVDFANRAIRCTITAFRFNEKHRWIEPVLARLEFIPEAALTALLHDLLQARPVQYRHVKRVLEKIGDAIPTALYCDVAHWAVRFVDHTTRVDSFSGGIERIEFLTPLFLVLPEDHAAWNILWPILEQLFQIPPLWQTNHGLLLRRVLIGSPLALAKRGAELMLAIAVDDGDKRARWRLLQHVAAERPDFGAEMAKHIIAIAPLPEDLVCVRDEDWAKPHLYIDDDAVHARALVHLEGVLKKAVMAEGQKEFTLTSGGWEVMFYVRWHDDDLGWARQLVEAIDHPRVLSSHVQLLLAYLRSMVDNGSHKFADLVAPSLFRWLKVSPVGIDPMAGHSGLFSTLVYRSHHHPQVMEELALLAAMMRPKLARALDEELISYVTRIAAQPPAGITGSAVRLTLDLVADHPDRQPELLSACQALLLGAQLRATADSSVSEELMDGFRYPTWFVSPRRENPPPRQVIIELAVKLEPIVAAVAKSGSERVRGQVAAFVAALKARDALTPELAAVRDLLARDPRASVRRFVAGQKA